MKRFLLIFLAVFAAIALILIRLAQSPDFEVNFERHVQSDVPIRTLSRSLLNPSHWHSWHYDATEVKSSTLPLRGGSQVTLQIDPRGQKWKRIELHLQIEEVSANPALVRARLKAESKGKISELFSDVRWSIEVQPDGLSTEGRERNKVIGKLKAKTHSPRARIFCRLAPRIILNQIFPADLQSLAGQAGAEGIDLSPKN